MIATYFQAAMAKDGYHAKVNGDVLYFAPLQMEMRFEHLLSEHYATSIKVSISHPTLLPNGLHELAVGIGDSEESRFTKAAEGWMMSDFPSVHSYLCPTQNDLAVTRLELVSQTGNQQFGWNVLIGPLLTVGKSVELTEKNESELFYELFSDIVSVLHSPEVLSIKCFVSKSPDGTSDVDCRMLGDDWIEGTNKLREFAQQLNTNGNLHWRKQYMIIYPRPLSELKSGKDLAAKVSEEHNKQNTVDKKWYEFWK